MMIREFVDVLMKLESRHGDHMVYFHSQDQVIDDYVVDGVEWDTDQECEFYVVTIVKDAPEDE